MRKGGREDRRVKRRKKRRNEGEVRVGVCVTCYHEISHCKSKLVGNGGKLVLVVGGWLSKVGTVVHLVRQDGQAREEEK